jgi:hypothetical protein
MNNIIRYKKVDINKIKTLDDVILLMKASFTFRMSAAEGKEWTTLKHLLDDEIHIHIYDPRKEYFDTQNRG